MCPISRGKARVKTESARVGATWWPAGGGLFSLPPSGIQVSRGRTDAVSDPYRAGRGSRWRREAVARACAVLLVHWDLPTLVSVLGREYQSGGPDRRFGRSAA